MCNVNDYIEELQKKLEKALKERDELRSKLEERVTCEHCEHFVPKIWDCDLYTGAHRPKGYCDAGEKRK